jgi:hypothetical protein
MILTVTHWNTGDPGTKIAWRKTRKDNAIPPLKPKANRWTVAKRLVFGTAGSDSRIQTPDDEVLVDDQSVAVSGFLDFLARERVVLERLDDSPVDFLE